MQHALPLKKPLNLRNHINISAVFIIKMGGILRITVSFSHHASILHLSIHQVGKWVPDILKLHDIALWDVTG